MRGQSPTSESLSPIEKRMRKAMAKSAVPKRSPKAVKYGIAELSTIQTKFQLNFH
jgi:hypothetical protein